MATLDTIGDEFARLFLIMTQLQTYLIFFIKSISLHSTKVWVSTLVTRTYLKSVDDGGGLNIVLKVNIADGTIDP